MPNRDKRKPKAYLQGFNVLAHLKDRMNNERTLKLDLKDVFNEVCAYAYNAIATYDQWVLNNYEVEIWQRFYDMSIQENHWAKEVVNIIPTRKAKPKISFCERKISKLTSAYFDANNIIT